MDKPPVRDMDAFLDPVHDAAFNACIKRLAGEVGMSAKALYKRLDDNDAMPLRFVDFVAIFWAVPQEARKAMLQPFLEEMGVVTTPVITDAQDALEAEVQEMLLDQHEQAARFIAVVREAQRDGAISDEELEAIRKERRALAESGNTILHRIERWHESGLKVVKG